MAAKTTAQPSFTWTMIAATEDTFDFTDAGAGGGMHGSSGVNVSMNRPQYVMITNLDATATNMIWFRFDGVAAVAAADGVMVVPADSFRVVRIQGKQLRLISAGTPQVTITRVSNPDAAQVIP